MDLAVTRKFEFDAAHRLDWHRGKCRNLHGHTYVLEVWAAGDLDSRGVVLDFAEIDALVNDSVIDRLDHTLLNETIENPTAERIALWVCEELSKAGLMWSRVRLWETASGSVDITR